LHIFGNRKFTEVHKCLKKYFISFAKSTEMRHRNQTVQRTKDYRSNQYAVSRLDDL